MSDPEAHRQLLLFDPALLSRAAGVRSELDEAQTGHPERIETTGPLVGSVAVDSEDLFIQKN